MSKSTILCYSVPTHPQRRWNRCKYVDSHLNDLIALNNKTLRILQNKPYGSPSNDLYKDFNTLSIKKLYKMNVLKLVQKFVHTTDSLPPSFQNYFQLNTVIHDHDTRTRNNMHLMQPMTSFGKRNLKYAGSYLWNNLDQDSKSLGSITSFSKSIKCKLFIED